MLPVLFSLGPFRLYTFGVFIFLAFFASMFTVWKRGKDAHMDEETIMGMALAACLWGLVGGRVIYGLMHLAEFSWYVWLWVNVISRPGFVFSGFLVGVAGYLTVIAKKSRVDFFELTDVAVVGLLIGQTVLALGDFFNGSGYGIQTNLFFGVQFAGSYDRRVPVQLVDTLWYGGLFWWLWKAESTYRTFGWYKGSRSEAKSGFVTAFYLLGVGLEGWLVSWLKPMQVVFFGLRFDQIVFTVLTIAGLIVLGLRAGGGWRGILSAWAEAWGLSGSLISHQAKTQRKVGERLRLGRDIFD